MQVERGHDGVAVVRLDRPKANGLSIEMVRRLTVVAEGLVEPRLSTPVRLATGATDRRNVSSPE